MTRRPTAAERPLVEGGMTESEIADIASRLDRTFATFGALSPHEEQIRQLLVEVHRRGAALSRRTRGKE